MEDQLSHHRAIKARLNREKNRLFHATTENERMFREHEVKMAQKELDGEIKFLYKRGINIPQSLDEIMMSDDELLAELMA
jgi:hypothetical protein